MSIELKTVEVNGVEYVRKSDVQQNLVKVDGLPYVMCRTYSAGVFAGYLKQREGKEATLLKARRIWYWDGAASLSQLATEGTSDPQKCKFPCEVHEVQLTEVIEIIPITEKAKKSISEVKIWQK